MANYMLPADFHVAFVNAYREMDFFTYVRTVLQTIPNEDDIWQIEKYELFQNAGKALSRISIEHTERIVEYDLI